MLVLLIESTSPIKFRPFLFLHERVEQRLPQTTMRAQAAELPCLQQRRGCRVLLWLPASQKIMRFLPVSFPFKNEAVVRHKGGFQFSSGLRQGRLLIKIRFYKNPEAAVPIKSSGTVLIPQWRFRLLTIFFTIYRGEHNVPVENPDLRCLLNINLSSPFY